MPNMPALPIAFPSSLGPINWTFENGDATVDASHADTWNALPETERAEIRVAVNATLESYADMLNL